MKMQLEQLETLGVPDRPHLRHLENGIRSDIILDGVLDGGVVGDRNGGEDGRGSRMEGDAGDLLDVDG